MHFFPQVLIAAIAWEAGFPHQHLKNKAPANIQNLYDTFRDRLGSNQKYARAFEMLNQIESTVVALNSELATIGLPDDPESLPEDMPDDMKNDIRAAYSLLQALDLDSTTWKDRIKDYG